VYTNPIPGDDLKEGSETQAADMVYVLAGKDGRRKLNLYPSQQDPELRAADAIPSAAAKV
jgi:hypothetical protein